MNKPIKVLHVLNTGSYSGAENVAISIIERLQNDCIHCYYVSLYGSIQTVLLEKGIEYIPIERLSVSNLKKVIKEIQPDIIHAHDYTASIIASLCFSKADIISHLHNNSPWIRQKGIYSFAFLFSSLFYKKIITVSDSIEKEYVFSHFIKKKIECIGNPVDTSLIQKKANEYDETEKYDMIFLGRLTPQKNPSLLIDILRILVKKKKDIRIAIVGEGEMYHEVETKLSSLKKNVRIYGFVQNPYPILKNSKVLCLPSLWEGYGLVAIEALSLGVPVVCSGTGGLKNIVNEECGKICEFDENKYVSEILKLISDEVYYCQKHNNAFIQANNLNNVEEYMKKITLLYEE